MTAKLKASVDHHSRIWAASVVLLVALLQFPIGNAASTSPPSKPVVRFVEVQPGVKLEVLDWGGLGAACGTASR